MSYGSIYTLCMSIIFILGGVVGFILGGTNDTDATFRDFILFTIGIILLIIVLVEHLIYHSKKKKKNNRQR